MSEAARRKAAGWPPLLRDVKGLRVRLARDTVTLASVAPQGLLGTVDTHGNGWHLLRFTGDPCDCCGVKVRVTRLSWFDLELV